MKYYISDLHLFHPAILQKCSRPFATIDDMHRTIFQNGRKKVLVLVMKYIFLVMLACIMKRKLENFLWLFQAKNTSLPGIMISRISIIGTSPALFYGAVHMQK